ncbi:MAG: uridine kinase [Candidatus Rokubacteria bacterium]|nr:uridine kinase [Candidatus Rokubacteria bacterium]
MFVIGIAGGSGSGKTTLAGAVASALGPDRVALLAHDAYYRDRSTLDPEARALVDHDVPDALDHEQFLADLARLKTGQPVRPPRYCFATHRRIGTEDPIEPREILIVEGLLLFHDPAGREALDLRIFVDAPAALRRQRRIARDTVERGRTRESVVRQFSATVYPAHVAYVGPTKAYAHLVLLNAGALAPLAEVAATVIRTHLARRMEDSLGARRQLA